MSGRCRGTRVEQQKGAGAVRILRPAGRKTTLAEQRCLLVAGDSADGKRAAEERLRRGHTETAARCLDGRKDVLRDAGKLERLTRPLESVYVVEHRAGRVGRVGCVHGAAGELPDEPAVDGSEGQLAPP